MPLPIGEFGVEGLRLALPVPGFSQGPFQLFCRRLALRQPAHGQQSPCQKKDACRGAQCPFPFHWVLPPSLGRRMMCSSPCRARLSPASNTLRALPGRQAQAMR